ncbi:tyrosine-type recombinase/integrase [Riemerella columbina]|uniref:tyrosine-type recombinase/integrase n=1 Tax=Riemerella columbina TaxID=103810 RepID=UPI0003748F18|nr:tyrosine-type recombinase/integrase [Riemerella columbina]
MKNYWTQPKVTAYPLDSGKDWYVWFRFNGGNPIRIKKGLNKIQNYDDRMEEALAMAEVIEERLNSGWIPKMPKRRRVRLNVIEAVEFGFKEKSKTLSKNSADNYKTTVKYFIQAAKEFKLDKMNVEYLERYHAKEMLYHLKEKRNWTNKNYNKHKGVLNAIFYEVLDADYIKINPFANIKNLKVPKKEANIPPTDKEMKLISMALKDVCYGFYVFCSSIYYCGIRPDELIHLKVSMLDLQNSMIHLPSEITKTDADRMVPISPQLKDLFLSFDLSNPDNYLFGTCVPNGGRHGKKKNYFEPNKYKVKEDTANKLWKKTIKDGLGIDKNMYSLKHRGADDKILAGMPLETVQAIFGHSTQKMTERYARIVKLKRFEDAKKIQLPNF